MKQILFSVTLILAALPAFGQAGDCERVGPPAPEAADNAFYVCHPDGRYRDAKGQWKGLPGGATIRVPAGKTEVVVLATNTALFEYRLSSEAVDSPEGKQLSAFLKAFGPYFTDVLSTEIEANRSLLEESLTGELVKSLEDAVRDLESALKKLDHDIDGLRKRRVQVLGAYAEDDVERLKESLKEVCADRASCRKLFGDLTETLLESYRAVEAKLLEISDPLRETATALSERERAAGIGGPYA